MSDSLVDQMDGWIEAIRTAEGDPEWLPLAFGFGVAPTERLRRELGLAADAPLPERLLGVPMEYTTDPVDISMRIG